MGLIGSAVPYSFCPHERSHQPWCCWYAMPCKLLYCEVPECLQALQQLWEPARFTYQVNNPSSQRQRPTGGSKQSAAVADAEEEEAGSSSSDDEGCLQQPQQASQVVTRGVEARLDPAGARSVCICFLKFC